MIENIILIVLFLNFIVVLYTVFYKIPVLSRKDSTSIPTQVYFFNNECRYCSKAESLGLSHSNESELEPESTPVPVPKADESRFAWKNQKKVPMTGAVGSSSRHNPPPKSGPLERPPGFAR